MANDRKGIGPIKLSKFAERTFQEAFPEAKPICIKRRKQPGVFKLNGKIVVAKWASYTQGNDPNHKDGWRITFPPRYTPDLIVVFAGKKGGVAGDYDSVLIFPRSDFPVSPSIRLDENNKEYIYDAQDLRDAVFMNLGALDPAESTFKDWRRRLDMVKEQVVPSKVREMKSEKITEQDKLRTSEYTIEVSPIDYLAFKQIANMKKKGQQLLFHDMLDLYFDEKCRNTFDSNLFAEIDE